MMNIDYTNKTVLVTGATRGIGQSIADLLYESGANLYLTGTKKGEVDELNSRVQKMGIERVHYLQVDFLDKDSMSDFCDELACLDRIDACINNAGINQINEFCEVSSDEFMRIMQVDLFSAYRILKYVVPKMKQNKYGRIVNIASIWSVISRPGRSSYTIAKNAVNGLTKGLAVELASHNVMVNSVSPGFTLTELTKMTNTLEQIEELEGIIPARRMATPLEIAQVVAFLCSEYNSYMTGQNITVDGGYTNV